MPKTSPGAKIRKAREARCLTRSEVAAYAGVSVNTMVRLENFDALPKVTTLHALSECLDFSIDELLAS
ncbi:helix-turn-helix domain-containing protein [Cryobacterium luteum]|uniref:XRE family transcriptional regulator n=1 Tax=Cryobacterium luteum TaxID=1424661 RepID=A0A1H8ATA6_9MICO|nr:helix-turn-helix transcriptional regulator [Cryobacterium luteum]TFB88626.1 XRE family transcriptional regulator [Cryobacterium luteum]SEM73736.1 Helix-turn-helix domain-containing protein [Cryobacterium luteum]